MNWMWVDWDDHNALARRVTVLANRVATLEAQMNTRISREKTLMTSLDAITAQVAQNTTVEASAIAMIDGLAQQIKDLVAADDTIALGALADQLHASATALAAAITANTPAAPAP